MTFSFDRFWHKTLGRPYRLAKTIDEGEGSPIVLLHGIGRTGNVWEHVVRLLAPDHVRVIAFDLLGFGRSPKPKWLAYNIDDHARSVISSLERMRLGDKITLVGHSMGCLVAVRVARLRPDLVRHMVLYEMPLYDGLPQKRRYTVRVNLYRRLYKKAVIMKPTFNPKTARLAERLMRKIIGFEISKESWLPFVRSLENTIMKQTAADDIKYLKMAMDVIYGKYDMLVIRGEAQAFFGEDSDHITSHTIKAKHRINLEPSQFIVDRIRASFGKTMIG